MAAVRGLSAARLLGRKCLRMSRTRSIAAIPVPLSEEEEKLENGKNYPEHIINIVEQISKLTLVETAELNELLKVRLKIPDAPMMAMGAMPVAQAAEQGEATEEEKEEQTEFTIKLTGFDSSVKVKLIKEVKSLIEGMNLVQAKKFVESVPQIVKENISKDEVGKLKSQLEAVGGTVEIE